jgi:hypothetical protein
MTEPYLTRLRARMAKGDSLEEAARYDMALWRAKATFVRAGLPVPTPLRRRKPLPGEVRALGARVHAYLEREDNASSSQVAAALKVTRVAVLAAIWPQDEPRLRPALTSEQRYPREAILVGLRAMSLTRGQEMGARGGVAVPATYWDTHRDPAAHPASPVVSNRFGGWREACLAAGIPLRNGAQAETAKRWTEEACLEAVRAFFAGGHGWSSTHYGRWAQGGDAPSVGTVTAKLGPWPALRKRLLG